MNNLLVSGLTLSSYRILRQRLQLIEEAGIRSKRIDARDRAGVIETLAAFGPQIIVHLAAVAHMDRSQNNPSVAFDHNIATLANSLEAARLVEAERLVFFSSSTVYGDFKQPHAEETDECKPKNIYGAHKLIGEQMVKSYGDSYALRSTIIRPQALYGPRCISQRVTQRFLERAAGREPLVVDGDGEDRLDFTHVADLVSGTRAAIERHGAGNETFNIAAGAACSLNELVAILRQHFPDLQYSHGPLDDTRPRRGTMSIAKARELLGYEPKWRIERGMADYVRWYMEFSGGGEERRGTQSSRRNRAPRVAASAH